MKRPICPACQQRVRAVNYYKEGVPHYRSRCEVCIKKNKKIKPPVPRWQAAGYKKKPTCDRCGFRARYSAQLLVYHVDGNLNNCRHGNLKTVCANCQRILQDEGVRWTRGDLTPDF